MTSTPVSRDRPTGLWDENTTANTSDWEAHASLLVNAPGIDETGGFSFFPLDQFFYPAEIAALTQTMVDTCYR